MQLHNAKIKIENFGLIGIIALLMLAFSYFILGFLGMATVFGVILLVIIPIYPILSKTQLEQDEKIIFSFFIGIGIFSSIAYWLGRFISFRISILITFIILTIAGFLINLLKRKNNQANAI